jgi:hypothetical protein
MVTPFDAVAGIPWIPLPTTENPHSADAATLADDRKRLPAREVAAV